MRRIHPAPSLRGDEIAEAIFLSLDNSKKEIASLPETLTPRNDEELPSLRGDEIAEAIFLSLDNSKKEIASLLACARASQ